MLHRSSVAIPNWIVISLIFISIMTPKSIQINLEGFQQGVRLLDFTALFFLLFFRLRLSLNVSKYPLYFFGFLILHSLFTEIYFNSEYSALKFISIIRFFEYFIFYRAFVSLSNNDRYFLASLIFFSQFILIFSEVFVSGLNPLGRSSSTLGGPWEVGVLMGSLFLYLISCEHRAVFFKVAYVFIMGFTLYYTQSRITVLALVFSFAYLYRSSVIALTPLVLFGSILLTGFEYGYANFSELFTSLFENKALFLNLLSPDFDPLSYRNYVDLSSLARIHHWKIYLHGFFESEFIWFSIIFGNGLLSKGLILDGGFIRLLADFGLIGVIFFIIFVINSWRCAQLRPYILFFGITMIAIEFYFASYAMVIVVLILSNYSIRCKS